MSNELNANISDYSQGPIMGPIGTGEVSGVTPSAHTQTTDISTLEASGAAAVLPFTPLANFPLLVTPQSNGDDTFRSITTVISNSRGNEAYNFLQSQQLKMDETTQKMLDAWSNSIKEMDEYIRQLITSPMYIQMQEMRLKGQDSSQITSPLVSEIQASNPTATYTNLVSMLSFVDRTQAFERVPPNATIPESQGEQDPAKALVLPFMATVIMGGALAIGAFEMSTSATGMSSTPFTGVAELVSRLEPMYPALIQNILPTINLMVMPLIYFTSWDSSIGSLNNKEKNNNLAAAQSFAREVIKMVSDPAFIMVKIVNKMEGAEKFTDNQKAHLAAMLKLILATVALCLLYSVEVGKTGKGKFWGMEPQEFKGMISGEIQIPDPSKGKVSPTDSLKFTLLQLIKAQFGVLPAQDKMKVLDGLFEYLSNSRNIEDMLDPAKVFKQVLSSSVFNSNVNGLESQVV